MNTREIKIPRPIVVFACQPPDLTQYTELPTGAYQLLTIPNPFHPRGERWFQVKGTHWGNARECWEAIAASTRPRLLERIEAFSRKLMATVALCVLAIVPIKVDWRVVSGPAPPDQPANVVALALRMVSQGRVQVIAPLPDGRRFLESDFSAGWRNLADLITGQRGLDQLNLAWLQQVHRDIFILLLLISLCLPPQPRFIRAALKFLLPLMLLPARFPLANPEIDRVFLLYYPAVLATLAALLWNHPQPATQTHRDVAINRCVNWAALAYNLVVAFFVLAPR